MNWVDWIATTAAGVFAIPAAFNFLLALTDIMSNDVLIRADRIRACADDGQRWFALVLLALIVLAISGLSQVCSQ